jgi:CheY-like chemotaxis protein/Arc/MetJ-type ribon-helix-helix transcriptional regulator
MPDDSKNPKEEKFSGLKKNKEVNGEENDQPHLSDEEIESLDLESKEAKEYMKQYQEQTDKYAIWRGTITEGFKKWLKGDKIYMRDKERISLYVEDKTKDEWQEFLDENKDEYKSFSKLIRDGVNAFIEDSKKKSDELSRIDSTTISNISHALKEPLTSIKGYSQLLLESGEYRNKLSDAVKENIKNIFDQSNLLENIIKNFLDNIKIQSNDYDVLLIEDDVATIKLITRIFESRGYLCKGVVSGSKGLEELGRTTPKVILLDIILPDLSGYDICKTIKSDKEYNAIPVYFLTAISGSEVKRHLTDTNADGYILKPFNFSDFEIIFNLLNHRA